MKKTVILKHIIAAGIMLQCGASSLVCARSNTTAVIRRHTTPNPIFAQHQIFGKNREKKHKKTRRANQRYAKNNRPSSQP